jgi:hypothetical protein
MPADQIRPCDNYSHAELPDSRYAGLPPNFYFRDSIMRQLTQRKIRHRARRDESLRNRAYREQVLPVPLKIHPRGFAQAIREQSIAESVLKVPRRARASEVSRRDNSRGFLFVTVKPPRTTNPTLPIPLYRCRYNDRS